MSDVRQFRGFRNTLKSTFPIFGSRITSTSEISSNPKKPSASSKCSGKVTSIHGRVSNASALDSDFWTEGGVSPTLRLFFGFKAASAPERLFSVGAIPHFNACVAVSCVWSLGPSSFWKVRAIQRRVASVRFFDAAESARLSERNARGKV